LHFLDTCGGRLIRNHPELLQKDTINVHDTTIVETIQTDTVFHDSVFYERLRDTIIINNDRLTIRQYHHRDSIFIEGECKGDTIIKQIPVPYEKVTAVTKEVAPKFYNYLIIGLVLLLILLGIKLIKT
jgi:hypothetical protein